MSARRSIPTWYAGNLFRSRLEARWAAFFDLLGWEWVYEPLDLDGYIPDFVLTNFKRGQLLVEVKPRITNAAMRRIEESGWAEDALVVGAYPVISGEGYDCGAYVGQLSQRSAPDPDTDADWCWGEGLLGCADFDDDKDHVFCPNGFGLGHATAGYACYRCGGYDGNVVQTPDGLRALWGRASAAVQWQPPLGPCGPPDPSQPCVKCKTPVTGENIGGFSGRPERLVWCERCAPDGGRS